MDFEGIYQSYCKDVFRYLRSLSAGEDLAEEITQETFVKALKAIDRFQGDKDIRAWLFTIAKHTYYTHCKREKRTRGRNFPRPSPDRRNLWWSRSSTGSGPFRSTGFCTGCREPYKEVFTLRVFGELPFEKIGLLFGKTPSWARVTFYRAKKQIIEYMEGIENEHHPL